MKKVKIYENGLSSGNNNADIGLIQRKKDGTFKIVSHIQRCRGYMGQYLLSIKQHENKVANWERFPEKMNDFTYKRGCTYIGVRVHKKEKNKFLKNIEWLHGREEKAGVKKSEVMETNIPNLYIVKGAKYWKDSCWKIMLYTFYIRCCADYTNPKKPLPSTNEFYYWPNLIKNENEGKLLANVKMHWKKEIFDNKLFYVQKSPWYDGYETIGKHNLEGFNSICSNKNPPMAKLLGII